MLHPGPDEAVDASGWNPALERGERCSLMRLGDVDHGCAARAAADLAADNDAVGRDLDGRIRHVADGSKVLNASDERVLRVGENAPDARRRSRPVPCRFRILTMFTAVPCGMNHDLSTSGSPARSRLTVWSHRPAPGVTNCLKLTNPLGAHQVLVSASTRPEISIPPFLKVSVGPELKRKRYVTETDAPSAESA